MDFKFDLEAFINKHYAAILTSCFTDRDLQALVKYNSREFSAEYCNSHLYCTIDCSICLEEFRLNEIIIEHPGCLHLYHNSCLS